MNLLEFGEPEEIRVPVAYGYLAAQAWGPKDGKPILGLHGLFDNAGTFESLLRYLPSSLRFVALEFSGHGRSSRLPKGLHFTKLYCLLDVCRFVKYLEWECFSIIGHSVGASVGLIYACAYPDKVSHVINLDFLYPGDIWFEMSCPKAIDYFFELEDQPERIDESATEEDALRSILQTRIRLPPNTGKAILNRCKEITEFGSYMFSRDARNSNFYLLDFAEEDIFQELENIRAHFLLIKGASSPAMQKMPEKEEKTKEILKRNCKSFKMVELPGQHYVHAENAQKTCELMKSFLSL